MQPGATLTVKVASKQRPAQLAFVRVSPRATLARKTLRTGRFTVTVPAGDGVTYELRATIAGKRIDCDGTALPIGSKPPPCIGLPAFEVLHQGESTTRRFAVPVGLAPGTYTVTALGVAVTVEVTD